MTVIIEPHICLANDCLPVTPCKHPAYHALLQGNLPGGCGWELYEPKNPNQAVFTTAGSAWLPDGEYARAVPFLLANKNIDNTKCIELEAIKKGYAVAVITLSDKGSQGLRVDGSGPLCRKMLETCLPIAYCQNFLIADDEFALRGLLNELALVQKYDLICTTGGTGLGPRDITPQATKKTLDLEMPGFVQAMISASLKITPRAAISRACAGVIGKCLVFNLPGSIKGAAENLEPLLPCLSHALEKLNGDASDCGN